MTDPTLWFEDYEEMLNLVLKPSGLRYKEFVEKGYLKGQDNFQKYLEAGFKTPTGKVELKLSRAEELGLPALPDFEGPPEQTDDDYPLVLTSAKSPNYLHSSYRWVESLRKREPDPIVLIHPLTADECGIKNGSPVKVETRWGSIVQKAKLTSTPHPKVVFVSHGWWTFDKNRYDWKRSNDNMLTTASRVGKEFGTPNLKGIACRVSPV